MNWLILCNWCYTQPWKILKVETRISSNLWLLHDDDLFLKRAIFLKSTTVREIHSCQNTTLEIWAEISDTSQTFGNLFKSLKVQNFQCCILARMDFPKCQYVPAASSSEQFFNQWSYLDLVIFSYFFVGLFFFVL